MQDAGRDNIKIQCVAYYIIKGYSGFMGKMNTLNLIFV